MAAIVTGLIPILRTAVDSTTTYKGRIMGFGFLCIRLVTLFVAQMPWFKLDGDFTCNNTAMNGVCSKFCFNQHFNKPVVMAWNFLFILLVLSVILMELFTSHVRSVFHKKTVKEKSGVEVESIGELKCAPSTNSAGVMILDMHGSRNAVFSYLFSLILRIVVEAWFIYVLLFWNLPKLSSDPFQCNVRNHGCPVLLCVVRATAEKQMSIYALVSISFLVILVSSLLCLYLIGHYLCNLCTSSSNKV